MFYVNVNFFKVQKQFYVSLMRTIISHTQTHALTHSHTHLHTHVHILTQTLVYTYYLQSIDVGMLTKTVFLFCRIP